MSEKKTKRHFVSELNKESSAIQEYWKLKNQLSLSDDEHAIFHKFETYLQSKLIQARIDKIRRENG